MMDSIGWPSDRKSYANSPFSNDCKRREFGNKIKKKKKQFNEIIKTHFFSFAFLSSKFIYVIAIGYQILNCRHVLAIFLYDVREIFILELIPRT